MACVSKRRGKWIADFRDQHGRRHWASFATKRAAEAALHQRLTEVKKNEYVAPSEELTFDALCKQFDTGHIAVAVRASTAKSYRGLIRLHLAPYFGPLKLRRISAATVERFRAELTQKLTDGDKTATRTVNKSLVLLSLMLRYAERHGLISANPVKHVKRLRHEPRRVDPLSPQEVQQLIANAPGPMWQALIATAALTGMRQGEVVALRWDEVDLTARTIRVSRSFSGGRLSEQPKTAAGNRAVDIGEGLASILRRWKLACPPSPLGLCFPNTKGAHLDSGYVHSAGFKPALKAAGLREVRFHDLRHGFASALLASGVDITRVSKSLGHASPVITMGIYAHVIAGLGQHVGDRIDAIYGASGSKVVAAGGSVAVIGDRDKR